MSNPNRMQFNVTKIPCSIDRLSAVLACANEFADAQSPTGSHPNVGLPISGDTGYGPEYPEDTDFEDRFSEEQYLVSVPNDGHSPFVPLIEYSFDRRSHRYDQSD